MFRARRLQSDLLFTILICLIILPAIGFPASRLPVKATRGMVVSAESLASAAGVEVLKNGGNAIDAAVAVGFALAVTYPEAGNIGGGGFMLIRLANGTTTMVDFREKAPGAATRDMYLDAGGNPVPMKSLRGPLASGVPGAVAGLLYALDHYGTKPRAAVMQRCIDLASRGVRVSERFALSLHDAFPDSLRPPALQRVLSPGGVALHEGGILRQPDLAKTLVAIRNRGRDGFYRGKIAEMIVAEMKRGGGIITEDDLAQYEPEERKPVIGSYRGYDIVSASPPSAGGIVLVEILNMLERFDLRSKGWNSSAAVHLFAAAAQRAYADRAEFLGDPQFNNIPVTELTSKYYAGTRWSSMDSTKAAPSVGIRPGNAGDIEHQHTTHYCVADRFGNVVSTTVTLNDLYGCRTMVDGAGFFLNNQMDDFSTRPGAPNLYGLLGSEANAIAPHKRMLSSMTPTIVLKNDHPVLLLGSRGGGRITTSVAQVIMNMIDFGMNAQEAVDAPRVHHQWFPDTLLYEPRSLQADVMENLRRMGYALKESETSLGRVQAIVIDTERHLFFGAPDPREEGVAIGY